MVVNPANAFVYITFAISFNQFRVSPQMPDHDNFSLATSMAVILVTTHFSKPHAVQTFNPP